jgi:hypothetical protein
MTKFDFLDSLEGIIVEQFSVLDERYARDMFKEMQETLSATIENENEIRYVLMDSETGQMESRMLYEEFSEAEKAAKEDRHGRSCQVATLILDQ